MKKIVTSVVVLTTFFFIYLCHTSDAYTEYRLTGERLIRKTVLNEKSAVMFDIDGTLVNGINPIKPIINLCNHAKSLGIHVVVITARPETNVTRIITRRQLAKHGVDYDTLIFTPAQNKKHVKRDLDLDFIFSVGDLPTDVDGDHGGHPILLLKK